MIITTKHYKAIIMLLASFSIASCSTYPNKFKCGDAKGLGCTMLHEVDAQIDSGQIEEAYKSNKKNKRCAGKVCPAQESEDILKLKQRDKAGLYPNEPEDGFDDESNLHF